MKINKLFFLPLYFFLFIITFGFFFRTSQITGGDYLILNSQTAHLISFSYAWCNYTNLGMNCAPIILHYLPYGILINIVFSLTHNGFITERVVWWLPFFFLSFFSIIILFKKIFPGNSFWILTPLIFIWNTYSLMIIGGGQVAGIGVAYAAMPLLFYFMISFFEKLRQNSSKKLRFAILFGIAMALEAVFDARILFLFSLPFILYLLMSLKGLKFSPKNLVLIFTPFLIVFLLHFFWIVPSFLIGQNPLTQLGPAYSTVGAVKFFSFANFENALALLHPNWPENVFGKTGFMRSEFILIPVLAFVFLLFKHKKEYKLNLNYFALLSLIGVFLAKGANPPFGDLYTFAFEHLPGFGVFRDPTKWYMLITVSYSILVPLSISKIYSWLRGENK